MEEPLFCNPGYESATISLIHEIDCTYDEKRVRVFGKITKVNLVESSIFLSDDKASIRVSTSLMEDQQFELDRYMSLIGVICVIDDQIVLKALTGCYMEPADWDAYESVVKIMRKEINC